MASTLNADNGSISGSSGLKSSADASGVLALQTNGTTALSISTAQAITINNDVVINGLTVGKGGSAVAGQTAVGQSALSSNTSGNTNSAFGYLTLTSNTTGSGNSGFGQQSLQANTSGSYNSAYGLYTLIQNTTGGYNTAFGVQALQANTTANSNTAVGHQAGYSNTTGTLTAIGYQALYANTTGIENTAIGVNAGKSISAASYNTFVGSSCGGNATGSGNTFVGQGAATGVGNTGGFNTCIGVNAGYSNTTGTANTYIGTNTSGTGAGYYITTGSKNSILGAYSGNQGGLDIRTASNYIVLSDGDGNPRVIVDNARNMILGELTAAVATTAFIQIGYNGSSQNAFVIKNTTTNYSAYLANFFNSTNGSAGGIWMTGSNATSFVTSSDYRLKKNVAPMQNALNTVAKLKPVTYDWIDGGSSQGFIAHELQEIVPEAVVGEKDAVNEDGSIKAQGIDTSFLVATLTAAIQELKAEVDSLKQQLGK